MYNEAIYLLILFNSASPLMIPEGHFTPILSKIMIMYTSYEFSKGFYDYMNLKCLLFSTCSICTNAFTSVDLLP